MRNRRPVNGGIKAEILSHPTRSTDPSSGSGNRSNVDGVEERYTLNFGVLLVALRLLLAYRARFGFTGLTGLAGLAIWAHTMEKVIPARNVVLGLLVIETFFLLIVGAQSIERRLNPPSTAEPIDTT